MNLREKRDQLDLEITAAKETIVMTVQSCDDALVGVSSDGAVYKLTK